MKHPKHFTLLALLIFASPAFAGELPALPVPKPVTAAAGTPPVLPPVQRDSPTAQSSQPTAGVRSYAAPSVMCNVKLNKSALQADYEAQALLLKMDIPRDCVLVLESKVNWLDASSDARGILFEFTENPNATSRSTTVLLQGYGGKTITVTQGPKPNVAPKIVKIIENVEASAPVSAVATPKSSQITE